VFPKKSLMKPWAVWRPYFSKGKSLRQKLASRQHGVRYRLASYSNPERTISNLGPMSPMEKAVGYSAQRSSYRSPNHMPPWHCMYAINSILPSPALNQLNAQGICSKNVSSSSAHSSPDRARLLAWCSQRLTTAMTAAMVVRAAVWSRR